MQFDPVCLVYLLLVSGSTNKIYLKKSVKDQSD